MDGMRFSTRDIRKGCSKYTMRTLALCFKNMKEKHLELIHGDDEQLSDDE